MAFNAFSFLVSFLALLFLRVAVSHQGQGQKPPSYWSSFKEGLKFFVSNRALVVLLITGMIFMFAGMIYNSFAYLFGVENLHVPESLLGVYVACLGLGVVAGMPLTAFLARRLGEVRILWIFLICHGISSVLLSRMTSMLPGMLCLVVRGFFSTCIFVTVRPLILRVTPRDFIGRVMAFQQPLITVASLLGGTLAGILTSTLLAHLHATIAGFVFGPLDTMFTAVGILVICAGLFAMLVLPKALEGIKNT
nr:MFS transporter [Ktedonosporobacter rubrisoli]